MGCFMSGYTILIPAYKPDAKLLKLLDELSPAGLPVYIVDDGSGTEYDEIFAKAERPGVTVFRYPVNRGKGGALKAGICNLMQAEDIPDGIITADADGQHTPEDIIGILDAMRKNPDALILGVRRFVGDVPLRSRFGNTVTRLVYALATGHMLADTQTGLRGLPECLFDELAVLEGDRYEYEMNMLLRLDTWGVKYVEVPIDTVYIDDNASSHFNTFKDSFRIYAQIAAYCGSSLISTVVDYGLYMCVPFVFPALGYAERYIIGRVLSAVTNYELNRHFVFKTGSKTSALKYAVLALVIMAVGTLGVECFERLGLSGLLAKVCVDLPLFVASYILQKKVVFKKKLRR